MWAAALEGLKWCQEVHTEVLEWFTTEAQVISDAPSDAAASSDSVTVVDQMKAALTATTASGRLFAATPLAVVVSDSCGRNARRKVQR